MTIFNEDSLRADIAKIWGEHGAHIEVFDMMLKMCRDGRTIDDKVRTNLPYLLFEDNGDGASNITMRVPEMMMGEEKPVQFLLPLSFEDLSTSFSPEIIEQSEALLESVVHIPDSPEG